VSNQADLGDDGSGGTVIGLTATPNLLGSAGSLWLTDRATICLRPPGTSSTATVIGMVLESDDAERGRRLDPSAAAASRTSWRR